MKVTIPDKLKEDLPPTTWGKILSATPVIMTVLATMLAGLASSEMTRAQYSRSLAAQQQSKAGDQWSFFQAKRLRGALQRNTIEILQSTAEVKPFDPAVLSQAIAALPGPGEALKAEFRNLATSPAGESALSTLASGKFPSTITAPEPSPEIKATMEAVENSRPDPELNDLVNKVTNRAVEDILRESREAVTAMDAALKPVNQVIDQMESILSRAAVVAGPAVARDFTVARLRYNATRYEAEARLNQAIANLYEVQVRKSNLLAVRHHARSQRFFYGMLAAQAAVIIATFAMAARKRNLLWSIAAGAGVIALLMAIYVYLYV